MKGEIAMNENKGYLSWEKYRKGVYFALATAIISGFSIYINKFAVMEMRDPFIFITVKNLAVAALLFVCLILPKALPELKSLSGKQWLTLGIIGCVGGSVPFLLFFHGLSLTTAVGAALIHKTLFIWIAILAVFFLGERLGRFHIAALAILIGGNILLLGWSKSWFVGGGELMIFTATIFWAVEAIVAKRVMRQVSSNVAAFGRMFFGAIVMLIYLTFIGQLSTIATVSGQQIGWIALTSLLLFGYVSCYYTGLKHAPASIVASILVLGSVITSLLYAVFDAKRYSSEQIVGMLLIIAATLVLWYIAPRVRVQREISPVTTVEK
jgi:drug/metabolite transporter (DMT)-like permease